MVGVVVLVVVDHGFCRLAEINRLFVVAKINAFNVIVVVVVVQCPSSCTSGGDGIFHCHADVLLLLIGLGSCLVLVGGCVQVGCCLLAWLYVCGV